MEQMMIVKRIIPIFLRKDRFFLLRYLTTNQEILKIKIESNVAAHHKKG